MIHKDPNDDKSSSLRKLLEMVGESPGQAPSLAQLKKEASGYGKRRADRVGSRDNLIYRDGYALDAIGGSATDADQKAGMLSSAAFIQEWLGKFTFNEENDVSLITLLAAAVLMPGVADWARQEGRYYQWERLSALRAAETAAFKDSAYADLRHSFWRKSPTREQIYLIGEICRLTDTPDPGVRTRRDAYEFIDQHNGNPRFWVAPERLPRPSLGA